MKVLIVTYYWPPAGGSGVQRWLKFVKYLRDFDIEPVIYTVDANYVIEDSSLLKEIPEELEIIRRPIFEPNAVFSFFGKKNKKQSGGFLDPNPSMLGRLVQYIRANFFIPDARKYWVKPSVKYLEKYLRANQIDTIITTGPPHSMHLIGHKLKEKIGVKWVADFRDPWTEIDYFHQLPLTQRSREKHIRLEQQVVSGADAVIVVGKTMQLNFEKYNTATYVITNGYDSEVSETEKSTDELFTITHIGMMNADRNPHILWDVLQEICEENAEFKKDLKVQLIGKLASQVQASVSVLDSHTVDVIEYVSHHEARLFQQRSQLLLLAINKVPSAKGIITGKIFEYLQAGRPILGIGPVDGDAAEIINKTNAGAMVDFNDKKRLKYQILEYYDAYRNGTLSAKNTDIKKYHRKELTRELSVILKSEITQK